MQLNAQLHSVKEDCEVDFIGTLIAIKEMGYTGVEFAGYYSMKANEINKALVQIGLNTVSAHIPLNLLRNNLEEEINTLQILGAKYIVCPYSEMTSLEAALKLADELTSIGNVCKNNGLTLLYHNHAHEFAVEEGKYLLDAFYDAVDVEAVRQEVDIYWLAYAGIDVYNYLEKYGKRNDLIHLKQIENLDTKQNVEASKGMIDFETVMDMVPTAQFIYEQEKFVNSRMDAMANSLKFIRLSRSQDHNFFKVGDAFGSQDKGL